jgi:plastocyanin
MNTEATPQNHEIRLKVGILNRAHPEKSTLTLIPAEVPVSNRGDTAEEQLGDTIYARPGDTITWIIDDPDITSILVMDDNKKQNVFELDPAPLMGSTRWSGLVDRKIKGRKEESYTICWSQDGMTYCFDPKIVVNP